MVDIIVSIILIVILATSITYMVNEKKKGRKCIGCSSSGCCPKCKKAS